MKRYPASSIQSVPAPDSIPFDSGAYVLLLRLDEPVRLAVGRLGTLAFTPGHYLYCGSARRNLRARVGRHLSRGKTLHWHIDHLTLDPRFEATGWACVPLDFGGECDLVRALIRHPEIATVHRGFGSSDCRQGCESHLLFCAEIPQKFAETSLFHLANSWGS